MRPIVGCPPIRVIYSTGYENIREEHKTTFGADVIDRISKIWGLDEEGEIQGAFRPTGHPGVRTRPYYCMRLFL